MAVSKARPTSKRSGAVVGSGTSKRSSKKSLFGRLNKWAVIAIVVVFGGIGSYLLYLSHADTPAGFMATVKQDGIYISAADGTSARLLPGTSGTNGDAAWNSNGTKLAFTRSNNIFTIDNNGLNLRQVTNYAEPYRSYHPSWSPDGTMLVYSRVDLSITNNNAEGAIFVINADGTNNVALTAGPNNSMPEWSPDGSKILYLERGSGMPQWVTMAPNGSNPTILTNTPTFAYGATWSADSQSIAFIDSGNLYGNWPNVPTSGSGNGVVDGCGVEIYSMASQQYNTVFKYANFACMGIPWQSNVSWSPDGQSIAFNMFPWYPDSDSGAEGGSDGDVYTIAATGGSLHKLHLDHSYGAAWGAVPPPVYAATCTINNVPATVAPGASFTPSVAITNTGNTAMQPSMISNVTTNGGPTSGLNNLAFPSIAPGASATVSLNSFTLPAKTLSDSGTLLSHSDLNADGTHLANFTCTQNFSINVPAIPSVTISPSNWPTLSHAAVTSDGSKTVVKMNGVGGGSGSVNSNTSATTLWKLDQFLYSNRGRTVKVCSTARSASTSTVTLLFTNVASTNTITRSMNYNSGYSSPCVQLGVKSGYKPNYGLGSLQASVSAGGAVYLNNVVLTAL